MTHRADPPSAPEPAQVRGLRVALIVSRYHASVTDRLRDAARAALREAGAVDDAVTVVAVPGTFELPLAARHAAESGRFDAIVCLGCVIRGETPHFEFIASAVAHGITAASAETGIPMAFGVLTTNTFDEAVARAGEGPANKGWEAALAAVELAEVCRSLTRDGPPEEPG